MTRISSHRAVFREPAVYLQRFIALLLVGGLATGVCFSSAFGQIEETRLTQPQLAPVPDSEQDDAEDRDQRELAVPDDRAAILGMTIEQAPRNRAIVIDVAVNSPAEGAGIKKGDYVVALNGLKIDSYDKWFEGVQRIIRDTPDGALVQLTIERNGRRANVPVKTLVATAAGAPRRVAAEEPGEPTGPGIVPPTPGSRQATAFPLGSGDDIFLSNQNFFGGDIANGRPNERAIAHLYLLAGAAQAPAPQPAAEPVDPSADIAGALGASANDKRDSSVGGFGAQGRIGLAGFRNRDQGMLVMVDVGMLTPGNYIVGIADPSAIMGELGGPVPESPTNPVTDPAQPNPSEATPTDPAQPADSPQEDQAQRNDRAQPANIGGPQQQRLQQPLRQAVETPPAAPSSPTPNIANQQSAPAGEVDPLLPTDTELSAGALGRPTPGMLAQIGKLTVDQSGTGRAQEIVEGLQVADVVGQAVVIYVDAGPSTLTIPPGGNTVDSANPAPNGVSSQNGAAQQSQKAQQVRPKPVAAGLIEIITARGIEGQTTESGPRPRQTAPTGTGEGEGSLAPLPPPQ